MVSWCAVPLPVCLPAWLSLIDFDSLTEFDCLTLTGLTIWQTANRLPGPAPKLTELNPAEGAEARRRITALYWTDRWPCRHGTDWLNRGGTLAVLCCAEWSRAGRVAGGWIEWCWCFVYQFKENHFTFLRRTPVKQMKGKWLAHKIIAFTVKTWPKAAFECGHGANSECTNLLLNVRVGTYKSRYSYIYETLVRDHVMWFTLHFGKQTLYTASTVIIWLLTQSMICFSTGVTMSM